MKIKYFAGGNRIKVLEKIYYNKKFSITEIYIADIEPNYKIYEAFAIANDINIIQVNKKDLEKKFLYNNEDILLSVGFRYLIPKNIFSLFRYSINIHPSLLPKYKGAYSGFAVIENGEKETGITAHFIDEGVDTGDIINQIKIPINIYDTIDTINKKLLYIEPDFVIHTLLMIKNNNIVILKQPKLDNETIYNKKRKPEDSRIDPNKSLIELLPKIKSCSEKFPAYFEIDGVKIKIKLEFEK
jgi:methionyl-tRNA formyltransferase